MKNEFHRDAVAIVLQGRACGLGVIRSLGRERIPLLVADPHRNAPGLHSRYCKSLIIPDPEIEPEMALDSLMKEGEKLKEKGVLFPSSDAFTIFTSKHRKMLSEHFKMILSPGNMTGELVNKRYQYAEARRVGMPMPATYYPSTLEEAEVIKDDLEYPVIIKPSLSHVFLSKLNRKAFIANGPKDLLGIFNQQLPPNHPVIVQSFIPGPVTNLYETETYVGQNGKVLAFLVRQKLRQFPEDTGMGTLERTINDPEIVRLGTDFVQSIGFKGIANLEFKMDDRDGKYKLMEINPRYSLQNISATKAGINFPLIQYLDLTEQPLPSIPDYADDVTWLDASRDILAYRSHKKEVSLKSFIQSWLGADCYAYHSWDDPIPAIARFSTFTDLISDLSAQMNRARGR